MRSPHNPGPGSALFTILVNNARYHWDGSGRKLDCFDDVGLFASDTAFTPIASCAAARALPDATKIRLTGRIASTGDTHFADRFYIQDPDRKNGLCVQASPWAVHAGDVVTVTGTLSTVNAERILTSPAYSASP